MPWSEPVTCAVVEDGRRLHEGSALAVSAVEAEAQQGCAQGNRPVRESFQSTKKWFMPQQDDTPDMFERHRTEKNISRRGIYAYRAVTTLSKIEPHFRFSP